MHRSNHTLVLALRAARACIGVTELDQCPAHPKNIPVHEALEKTFVKKQGGRIG